MKTIILLLICLFMFCINLEHNKTNKQSDTITTSISVNHDVIITSSTDLVLDNSFEYTNYVYSTDYLISNVISNHFIGELPANKIFNNLTKVQTVYTPKTIGLQYMTNSKYFNIYLYHSINKLGFT